MKRPSQRSEKSQTNRGIPGEDPEIDVTSTGQEIRTAPDQHAKQGEDHARPAADPPGDDAYGDQVKYGKTQGIAGHQVDDTKKDDQGSQGREKQFLVLRCRTRLCLGRIHNLYDYSKELLLRLHFFEISFDGSGGPIPADSVPRLLAGTGLKNPTMVAGPLGSGCLRPGSGPWGSWPGRSRRRSQIGNHNGLKDSSW